MQLCISLFPDFNYLIVKGFRIFKKNEALHKFQSVYFHWLDKIQILSFEFGFS